MFKKFVRAAVLLFVFHLPMAAKAEVNDYVCGSLQNGYGPFDFRSDKDKWPIVEGAHFTPDVANLIKGRTSTIGGDLDYTLRAFPNQPQALMSMMRLAEKEQRQRPRGAHYSVECYFNRAIRFRDDDANVRMVYAIYLSRHKRNAEALEHLKTALELGEDNANLYYNIGLVYFSLGKYDEALSNAHHAYQEGFPLPGLRDKLKKAGKWKDFPKKEDDHVQTDETGAKPQPEDTGR